MEFVRGDLNFIRKTPGDILEPSKKALVFSSYIDVDVVKNISRHVDLTNDVCNIHLRA